MKRILRSRTALATAASLSLIGALAGCASTTSTDSAGSSASSGTSANSTSDNTSSYKDGTYTADGTYVSPGGQEEIAVTVTVKSNLITAVNVKSVMADSEAAEYQSRFASGISSLAIGKSLATLSVTNVAGSSLTSQGFNAALATIRSNAQA
jgi:uncharacterized protein with FMN-binding domain